MEKWKPISHYDGLYEISSLGRVRSIARKVRNGDGKFRELEAQYIKPYKRPTGYMTVKLASHGKKKSWYVHRLVASEFIGEAPEGHEVCHSDGDKSNNCAENLYWGTRKQNIADSLRLGTHPIGEAHGMAKLTEDQVIAIRNDQRKNQEIAIDYNICRESVSMIKRRHTWKHI